MQQVYGPPPGTVKEPGRGARSVTSAAGRRLVARPDVRDGASRPRWGRVFSGVPIHCAGHAPEARRIRPRRILSGALLLVSLGGAPAAAQGLPEFAPINPVAQARSGLYFQPYREAKPGHLSLEVRLDYGSAIEYNFPQSRPGYLLDGEFLRLQFAAARDVRPNLFVFGDASLDGAYAGFLDGFLNWYHRLLGINLPERDARPNNVFAYQMALGNGLTLDRSPSDLFLGDTRIGAGYRWSRALQTTVSVTLPTSTAPDGYGRGTVSVNTVNTARVHLSSRFTYEGSLGLGWTPTHGDLTPYQKTAFVSATSGLRFRFWGLGGLGRLDGFFLRLRLGFFREWSGRRRRSGRQGCDLGLLRLGGSGWLIDRRRARAR